MRSWILKNINWNCDVKTKFNENNLGCGKAVSQAITWFFDNEEEGIILEDDCLPSQSFFMYCEELLNKYKNDERIMHIAGNNPLTESRCKGNASYYFVKVQHCWGWASWKRAWKYYNLQSYDTFKSNNMIKRKNKQKYWMNIFDAMSKHTIDTWDYQWTYSIFQKIGFV